MTDRCKRRREIHLPENPFRTAGAYQRRCHHDTGRASFALAYFADKNQSLVPSFLGHMASNLLAIGARYEIIPLPHNVFFHIILAIVFGALASTLFGLQFKLERLK